MHDPNPSLQASRSSPRFHQQQQKLDSCAKSRSEWKGNFGTQSPLTEALQLQRPWRLALVDRSCDWTRPSPGRIRSIRSLPVRSSGQELALSVTRRSRARSRAAALFPKQSQVELVFLARFEHVEVCWKLFFDLPRSQASSERLPTRWASQRSSSHPTHHSTRVICSAWWWHFWALVGKN